MLPRLCWGLFGLSLLGGCGGGGGDGGPPPLSFTFSPNPLIASFYPNQLPGSVPVSVAVTGTVQTNTVYLIITDTGGVFSEGSLSVNQSGPNTYSATLATVSSLSVGAHNGTLQLRACGDPACNSLLGSGSLPYSVVIKAPIVSLLPNPFDVSAVTGGFSQLTASVQGGVNGSPLFVHIKSDSAGTFVLGQPFAMTAQPQTGQNPTYLANLPVPGGLAATLHSGTLGIDICGDLACQTIYESASLPYSAQVLSVNAGQAGVSGDTDGSAASASFSNLGDIAVDAAGNLFAADQGNNSIRKVTPSGVVTTLYHVPSGTQGLGRAIAVDPSGNIFFVNNPGSIQKLVPSGTVTSFGNSLGIVGGLATDSSGNVYAASLTPPGSSQDQAFVSKFSPAGGSPTSLLEGGSGPDAFQGIAVDGAGNLYISDSPQGVQGNVSEFSPHGAFSRTLVYTVSALNVAIDSSSNVLVTNTQVVYKATQAGAVSTVVPAGAVLPNGAICRVEGLALTPNGQVLVSDSVNNVILGTTLP